MKTIRTTMLLALFAMMAACTEDDYKLYDTTQTDAVSFDYTNLNGDPVDSLAYVFNYDIADTHVVALPVTLMGMPLDHDRKITVRAVADSSDMKEGVNYTIDEAVLPARAVKATIKVNLLRDKDPDIRTMAKHLVLHIENGDELWGVGRRSFRISYSDIRPTKRPSWWSTWDPMPVYSFESAQLFFQYFYAKAPQANPDIFNEMVARYGDYFVKATSMQGPSAMYGDFLKMYVLIPMYKDHPDLEWQSIPKF
ncbi:MAG: DUF4843 domain-containing protein [Prevotella sp.]|nr:DUF4843 domain-containing protein [Prevotella sp.]